MSAIGKGTAIANRAALPKHVSISTIWAWLTTGNRNGALSALEIFYAYVGFGKEYGYEEAAKDYRSLILPLSNPTFSTHLKNR